MCFASNVKAKKILHAVWLGFTGGLVSLNLSFTWNTLGHASKRVGHCSSVVFVWNVLIVSGP